MLGRLLEGPTGSYWCDEILNLYRLAYPNDACEQATVLKMELIQILGFCNSYPRDQISSSAQIFACQKYCVPHSVSLWIIVSVTILFTCSSLIALGVNKALILPNGKAMLVQWIKNELIHFCCLTLWSAYVLILRQLHWIFINVFLYHWTTHCSHLAHEMLHITRWTLSVFAISVSLVVELLT